LKKLYKRNSLTKTEKANFGPFYFFFIGSFGFLQRK